MKLAGRKIQGPNVETIVIPRPDYQQPVVDEKGQPIYEMNGDGQSKKDSNGQSIQVTETISGDIEFRCQAVLDYSEFKALVPEPEPGRIWRKGQPKDEPDFDDPKYKQVIDRYNELQTSYMILKSLEATPDLHWEKVDMSKPETWDKYKDELKEAGFNEIEIVRIVRTCAAANSLDEDKLKEAKERFLHTREKGRRM